VTELFSWKSPTARKMELKAGSLSDARMIELMVENPQLIRRPLIVRDGKLQLGFGKDGLKV
jgi:arsenate reductase-like glutaredoxin family protein